MAKILVTPVNPKFQPREYEGELTFSIRCGEEYYYIAGQSFSKETVTILEGEVISNV